MVQLSVGFVISAQAMISWVEGWDLTPRLHVQQGVLEDSLPLPLSPLTPEYSLSQINKPL